jgi:hypothetical protein
MFSSFVLANRKIPMRGRFKNTRGGNGRGAGEWGQYKKYDSGITPLEKEQSFKNMMPLSSTKTAKTLAVINDMIGEANKTNHHADAAALNFWKQQIVAGSAGSAAQAQFVQGFWGWLIGQGSDEDYKRTLWGKDNIAKHNSEVAAYVDQFAKKRLDYAIQLNLLSNRVPESLNAYFLYYKYIVQGNLKTLKAADGDSYVDIDPEDFLNDWEIMHAEFDIRGDVNDKPAPWKPAQAPDPVERGDAKEAADIILGIATEEEATNGGEVEDNVEWAIAYSPDGEAVDEPLTSESTSGEPTESSGKGKRSESVSEELVTADDSSYDPGAESKSVTESAEAGDADKRNKQTLKREVKQLVEENLENAAKIAALEAAAAIAEAENAARFARAPQDDSASETQTLTEDDAPAQQLAVVPPVDPVMESLIQPLPDFSADDDDDMVRAEQQLARLERREGIALRLHKLQMLQQQREAEAARMSAHTSRAQAAAPFLGETTARQVIGSAGQLTGALGGAITNALGQTASGFAAGMTQFAPKIMDDALNTAGIFGLKAPMVMEAFRLGNANAQELGQQIEADRRTLSTRLLTEDQRDEGYKQLQNAERFLLGWKK